MSTLFQARAKLSWSAADALVPDGRRNRGTEGEDKGEENSYVWPAVREDVTVRRCKVFIYS